MNDFQSEPYKIFLESHTHLKNYIKISTVAVDYLYNSNEDKNDLSKLLNDLILKSGERWTSRVIKDSKNELITIKNDLTKSAIIWVYSAFDVFFKQAEGILSPHFPNVERELCNKELEDDNREHKVVELYQKLKWNKSEIEDLLIILKFFEALRHAIAHNYGNPSGKLIEIASSDDFKNAVSNWKTKFPKKTISPPPIIIGKIIELKPHHSIFYSEACLRIAKDINRRIFEILGLKFFVDKTIKKHLLDVKQLTKPECHNLTRYLIYHIKNDFNISIYLYDEIYKFYTDNELIKEHKKRYNSLKNIH